MWDNPKTSKKQLLVVTLLIGLAVIACLFVFSAVYIQNYFEHDLQLNLLSTAQYASFNIAAKDIQGIEHTNDIYFNRIRDQLIVIEGIYNLKDGLAYVVELKEEKPVFSVMTNEVPFRNHLYPEKIAERIHTVYRGEEIVADYYEDENGSFISVIVPLYDESKVIAALEIDFPGEEYKKMLYDRVLPFLIGLFVLLVLALTVVFIILLKLYNARLEQFKQSQFQLIQSDKMVFLSRLVAGITHEANTPISTIKSTSDILERSIDKISDVVESSKSLQEVKSSLSFQKAVKIFKNNNKLILNAGDRLARMIDRLKKFSRLDEAECQKSDINESLETTLSLVQSEFNNKIKVIKDFGEVPEIYAFPGQLNQMFMNLLENAAHAIQEKGTIKIITASDNTNIYIKIADTGKGIPSEKLDDLFRVNFTTRNSHVRMGMGLWNAYNIVQRHHGGIKVISEVGKGTEFIITLPITLAAQKICN